MHRAIHHDTTLDDLPVELIPEIASYLDPNDILSLQQTSKRLRKSINVPVVWRTLAKTYATRHFHIYQPQSGGFEDLTQDELHKWIKKRLDFDRIWKAQRLQPRFRTLLENVCRTSKLVPGGRWLLVGCLGGSVGFYDLDSEKPARKTLIHSSEGIEGFDQNISGLEIYTDLDRSGLHFNLAIHTEGRSSETEWLHVWQIKVKNGNLLTAQWQASIPTSYNRGHSDSLSIGRHAVVCSTRDLVCNLSVIKVYWWKRCSKTSLLRSQFLAPLGTSVTYLIGNGRILCANRRGGVNLYDIPEPKHISTEPNLQLHEDIPNPKTTWSYTFSNSVGMYYSPLYHDGTTYRFVVSTSDGIFGFTIPTTKKLTPSTIQLSTFYKHRAPCVPGLFKAFAFDNVNDGVRIGYGWESNGDGSAAATYTRGEFKGTPPYIILRPAFDEESGRFVYHQRDRVVILDFLDNKS